MRNRRVQYIVLLVAAIAVGAIVAMQTAPLAQEAGAPPGGPGSPPGAPPGGGPGGPPMGEPGMAGGPGMGGPGMGMPGAAGGGTFEWKTYEPPAELTMTYAEFLAQTGLPRADIPQPLLVKEDGTPAKYTKNAWHQLQRLYQTTGVAVREEELKPGRFGKGMDAKLSRMEAYYWHAMMAVAEAYAEGVRGNFRFEIGYPQMSTPNPGLTLSSVSVRVPVVMRVKPAAQSKYPERVFRRLKKFDCLGEARSSAGSLSNTSAPFYVMTQKGGYYQPQIVHLPQEANLLWTGLWGATMIAVALKDRAGQIIEVQMQPAGFGPDILAKMIYPDTIFFNPRYKLLVWPEGAGLSGKPWKVSGTKGWAYEFTFNLNRSQLRRLHSAEAKLIPVALIGAAYETGRVAREWKDLDKVIAQADIRQAARQYIERGGQVPSALAGGGGAPGGPGAAGPGPGAMPGMPGPGMPGEPGMAPGGPAMPPAGGPEMPPGPAMP